MSSTQTLFEKKFKTSLCKIGELLMAYYGHSIHYISDQVIVVLVTLYLNF